MFFSQSRSNLFYEIHLPSNSHSQAYIHTHTRTNIQTHTNTNIHTHARITHAQLHKNTNIQAHTRTKHAQLHTNTKYEYFNVFAVLHGRAIFYRFYRRKYLNSSSSYISIIGDEITHHVYRLLLEPFIALYFLSILYP